VDFKRTSDHLDGSLGLIMSTQRAFEPRSRVTFDLKHAVFVENMTAHQFTPYRRDDDVIFILANGTHVKISNLTNITGMTACIPFFNEIFHTMMTHI
jgi:hypothetical protein